MLNQIGGIDSEGVHAIANTNNGSRVCDVVFMHGLGGKSHSTWQNGSQFFWPRALGEDNAELGVWTVGFPGGFTHLETPGMLIAQRAANVAYSLSLAGLGDRPIFFIVHSLGGLVVKELVVRSQILADVDQAKITAATKGIVFCGTPHQGSDFANVATKLFRELTQDHVREMQAGELQLNMLHDGFIEWQRRTGTAIASFAETRPLFSSGRFGRILNLGIVVERSSANPSIQGCTVRDIDADHIELVKPENRKSLIYAGVKRFIENEIAQKLYTPAAIPEEAKNEPPSSVTTYDKSVATIDNGVASYQLPKEIAPNGSQTRASGLTLTESIEAFLGADPIVGDDVISSLVARGPAILLELLERSSTFQHEFRLRKFCIQLGPAAIDPLIAAIKSPSWQLKIAAAPCFYGLNNQSSTQNALYKLLKIEDFDVQRLAIEAIGYIGYSSSIRWQLINLAKFDNLTKDRFYISDYSLGKLYPNVIEALVRGFCRTGDQSELDLIRQFFQDCQDNGLNPGSYLSNGFKILTPAAADPLISDWLWRSDGPWACEALRALANLGLRRAVAPVARRLSDPDAEIRVAAGICLGADGSHQAAATTAATLSPSVPADGASWAASTLIWRKDIDWPNLGEFVTLAGQDHEISDQMLVSLAMRGETDVSKLALAKLTSTDPFARGAGAIALAYSLGKTAADELNGLANETASDMERVFIITAEILAGRREQGHALHQALQKLEFWPRVRPFWRWHILAALRIAGSDPRIEGLWAELSNDTRPRIGALVAEFAARACR